MHDSKIRPGDGACGGRRDALFVLGMAACTFWAGVAWAASSVPFSDAFSDSDGFVLDGQRGWSTTGDGTATVQGGRARLQNARISNSFTPTERAVSISVDVEVRYAEAPYRPSGSRFAFYVNTNGLVTAYSGASETNLSHAALAEGSNVTFQLLVDYPMERWSLSLDGALLASDLALHGSTLESQFEEFGAIDTGTNGYSYIDNVSIQAAATANPLVLPFEEPYDGLALGGLDGQRGWSATDGIVQDAVTRGGRAAAITHRNGDIEHSFIGGQSNVWTQVQVRPLRGVPPAPPSGATFAYFVNSNNVVVAYDGNSATALTNTSVGGSWVTFTTFSDYQTETWDLYLNGTLVAEDFGFYTTNVTAFTTFGIAGGDTNTAAFADNVYAGMDRPRLRIPGTVLVIH